MISKPQIEEAQLNTTTDLEAARYLHISLNTYKKYARMYEIHNPKPAGQRKWSKTTYRNQPFLKRLLAGELPTADRKLALFKLVQAGVIPAVCDACGFGERRIDGGFPGKLMFRNGHANDFTPANLYLHCLNCVYLLTGRIDKQFAEEYLQAETQTLPLVTMHQDDVATEWESVPMTMEELEQLRNEALEGL